MKIELRREACMTKIYMIWWHSKYIDEIDREVTTITEIVDKMHMMMKNLEELKQLEKTGKIKVKLTGSLNPIYIKIVDPSAEPEVARNPLVEVMDK
jgi:DNA repair photolyase